jgi:hypothetical protein
MEDEIISAEQIQLELTDALGHLSFRVVLVNDHAAEDEYGILPIDDRETVVARFIEKHDIHTDIRF